MPIQSQPVVSLPALLALSEVEGRLSKGSNLFNIILAYLLSRGKKWLTKSEFYVSILGSGDKNEES
jgi:hypothetical protein